MQLAIVCLCIVVLTQAALLLLAGAVVIHLWWRCSRLERNIDTLDEAMDRLLTVAGMKGKE